MKKKIILLLTATTLFSLLILPIPFNSAAETLPTCDHSSWQEITEFPSQAGSYVLAGDLQYGGTISSGTVDICLNGHSIPFIIVNEGATLNLHDCNGTGKITLQSKSNRNGIFNDGTFNMYGGIIADHSNSGVFNNGTFNMYNGKITNNTTTNFGGGVENQGAFNMYGGEISNNTATSSGGGVYHRSNNFTMYGGKIANNTAKTGGGISIVAGMSITLSGGEISGNSASVAGSGVMVDGGNLILNATGNITVLNNTVGGVAENIYTNGNSTIKINSLNTNSKLGITNKTIATCAPSEAVTIDTVNTDYSSCFISDSSEFEIVSEESNGIYTIKLLKPHSYDETYWYKNDTVHFNYCFGCLTAFNTASHNWNDGVITKEPTTEAEGVRTYTCTVCPATKTEAVAKLPTEETTAPTTSETTPPTTEPTVPESNSSASSSEQLTTPTVSEPTVTDPPPTETAPPQTGNRPSPPSTSAPAVTLPPLTEEPTVTTVTETTAAIEEEIIADDGEDVSVGAGVYADNNPLNAKNAAPAAVVLIALAAAMYFIIRKYL